MPGGRPAGVEGANKREARALLRDKYPNWHPLVQMAEIANDPDQGMDLRFQAAKEVNAYLIPKLRAIEVSGKDGGPIAVALSAKDGSL